jgi:alkyl sulfatase BDS1-like metallo-beta-lactamase superfamily hydrolase
MTTRRDFFKTAPAAGASLALTGGLGAMSGSALAQEGAQISGWHSPSLVDQTVTGPNGVVTTQLALGVNASMGVDVKAATEVAPGVFLLSGWGIASSVAIKAAKGWIIVDTGDSTRAAAEMRAKLESAVGGKIKVAAILLTHWHYGDGTGAWADKGTEVWGHEWLDSNRAASNGVNATSGFFLARAIAQFGVLHPTEGPDAFPNVMGFTPEKLLAQSSYMPPTKLFTNGKVETFTIAGEQVEVAPNRSDTTDSVGFYFPARSTWITNFMVPGTIFNIYTLRGGPFRNPLPFIEDCRHLESKDAKVLLDIHAAAVVGRDNVRAAIQRSSGQVQVIYDQTVRMIARGMDAREAAEAVYMPTALREGWETYGQVESHVRQIYNGKVGWFGHDVYDINPLSLQDEAARTIALAGGAVAVRKTASDAAAAGGIGNWQWALKLTSMLLRLDPQDAEARQTRSKAARALGQRTTSANARGFYITEALELDGKLLANGKPVTVDLVRAVLGTPRKDQLLAAPASVILEFLRFMVDSRKAEGKAVDVTLAIPGEKNLQRVILRNGVMLVERAKAKGAAHVEVSRAQLAGLVLGSQSFAGLAPALAVLDAVLDRSHLKSLPEGLGGGLDDAWEQERLIVDGEQ